MIEKSYNGKSEIGTPTPQDMALINKFSLKELQPQDVFCFGITLCDNDIDRDFERFSEEALKSLEQLFVGKTGIQNHSMKSEDQACRTYKTQLIHDNTRTTADGKPYIYLKAWCYTIRNEKNNSLITDIEAGIKKEVSISCASANKICSICGKAHCQHLAGRKYNGEICCKTITDITDAYEWSFVAVPAQRNAGVTKSFIKEKSMEQILKSIKEGKSITLDSAELLRLDSYITELNKQSEKGEKYRQALVEQAKKSFSICVPQLDSSSVDKLLKGLDIDCLEQVNAQLKKSAEKLIPVTSQLYVEEQANQTNANSQFKF